MTQEKPTTRAGLDEEGRSQYWATLALRHIRGLGPRSRVRLLRHFGSALAAMENIAHWDEAGIGSDKAAEAASGSWRTTALKEWNGSKASQSRIVLWHHACYPELLRRSIDAPPLLYCHGDISLLGGPCLAIVGSRNCTKEGVSVAADISRQLAAAGLTIVSGMAQGIDRVAHTAALSGIGRSIAVLGTGIDRVYPDTNADLYDALCAKGLVITEFAPDTPPVGSNFPVRNRIISGLSLGTLVVEGTLRSGSLVTARQALEQNRDVFAIPGPATAPSSRGCQELIRQGAKAVFNAEDILHDLAVQLEPFGLKAQAAPPQKEGDVPCVLSVADNSLTAQVKMGHSVPIPLSDHDEKGETTHILALLHACGPSHVDVLCAALEQPAFKVSALLTEMEISGLVKRLPGARYMAVAAQG